jgi:hypothetical protein
MSRALVLTLIDTLGLGLTDSTERGVLYDDVVRELGNQEIIIASNTVSVTAGTASYAEPSTSLAILEIHSDQGVLEEHTALQLNNVFGNTWREKKGSPQGYNTDDEDDSSFRLVPIPDEAQTLTVVHTSEPTDVPVWFELPITLEALYRAFVRESTHQDLDFARSVRDFASALFALLGIEPLAPQENK